MSSVPVPDKDINAIPYWYYDKKDLQNTPSLQDGIDYEAECRYRKEGARFIIDTGSKMDLGYNTMATGVVYFHRFYMFHSFRSFPRYVTACCCLFLAGKVEETPKKCKDIIKQAKALLTEQKFATFGEDPKEEVMTLERILLQTIKFDLQVEHPYSYLLKYAKCLKGDKAKLQKMVQMAWTFVNDSLCTTLSLQWEPEVIAVALMFLAGKLSKFEVVDWNGRNSKHSAWWDMFVEDITTELLEDICHQVLDLYSPQPHQSGVDSPPLTQHPKSNAPKLEKKSANTSPATISPVNTSQPSKTITPTKNSSEIKIDTPVGQPIKTVVGSESRYSYPSTYGPVPNYPPAYTTPIQTPPPNVIPVPRASVFSEPPPNFPASVNVPPPNYFPASLSVHPPPSRPPFYQPPQL